MNKQTTHEQLSDEAMGQLQTEAMTLDILRDIDQETAYWSGGFERARRFPELVALGEAAVPTLLARMKQFQEKRDVSPWPSLEGIHAIFAAADKPMAWGSDFEDWHDKVLRALETNSTALSADE